MSLRFESSKVGVTCDTSCISSTALYLILKVPVMVILEMVALGYGASSLSPAIWILQCLVSHNLEAHKTMQSRVSSIFVPCLICAVPKCGISYLSQHNSQLLLLAAFPLLHCFS